MGSGVVSCVIVDIYVITSGVGSGVVSCCVIVDIYVITSGVGSGVVSCCVICRYICNNM